jgi:tetratricopeptide (TPR) repeat protein
MTSKASTGGTRARRAATPRAEPPPLATPASRRENDPDVLAALEDQRDFLLRSLDDLEREYAAGDVDETDYESLKDDYTARAASAIKAIEQRRTASASARRPRRWGIVVATVALIAAVGLGAGWLVAASSGEREPGETISGDIRRSTIDELARAADYTARATAAQQAGDSAAAVTAYQNALSAYSTVLEQQPDNVEALTYRGWLLHVLALQAPEDIATRLDRDALAALDRAIAVDPDYPDARIFRAILHEGAGRPAEAAADLAEIDAAQVPPGMAEMVDGLRARVQSGG